MVVTTTTTATIPDHIIGTDENSSNLPILFSIEGLIDELTICLAGIEEIILDATNSDNNTVRKTTVRKYYRQAKRFMKWLPIVGSSTATAPIKPFKIYLSDLTPDIKNDLQVMARDADHETLYYVLKQAVGRLFENINFRQYHLSVAKHLKVTLEK